MNPEKLKAVLDQVSANYNAMSLALIIAREKLVKIEQRSLPLGEDGGEVGILALAQSAIRRIDDQAALIGEIQ